MSNNKKRRMSQIPRAKPVNQQVQIPMGVVNESPNVKCSECEGFIFFHGVEMKKISAIMSPDGIVKYVKLPVLICFKCQAILPEKP